MDYNKIIRTNGRYIVVLYTKMYETIAKMVLQHYDTYQFNGTLFVINVLLDNRNNLINYRKECPKGKKYIYYQLQNIFLNNEYVGNEYMDQFDEIWDFSLANINYYPPEVKQKACFMPLRYVDIPKIEPQENYKYDICFIGTTTPYRQDMLSRITKYWTSKYCKVKIISGIPYSELYDEIKDCKYIIDLPRRSDSGFILGATRILEAICSGKQVIIENIGGAENLFSWIVKGYTNMYDVYDIVKENPVDNAWVFKVWTDTDVKYEEYRQILMGNNYKQKIVLT